MTLSRRDLLGTALGLPSLASLLSGELSARPMHELPGSPSVDDEERWEAIAREFLIEGVHLNTGTYGACPVPVLEATVQQLRSFERITRQEHPDGAAIRADLESLLGAWPGSTAVVRNTTEAMNIVANGIELEPGDEILTTTHEHIGGICCWELLQARRGVVLKTFTPPLDPGREAELAAAWMERVTPRTKVLSISHVLFSTGMIQPVEALVRMARERGIISVIDGAHPPGMLQLDLRRIDADYYASSPHKWLLAPKGTGLLVTRPDRLEKTWPLVASGDWERTDHRRFEHVGTINEAMMAGLGAALKFYSAIGPAAIEARIRSLATTLMNELARIPGVTVFSPRQAEFRSAMISFRCAGVSAERLQGVLGAEGIRTRRIAEHGLEYLRLSTHYYVLPRHIERAVALVRRAATG